jgi:hypothetical protein
MRRGAFILLVVVVIASTFAASCRRRATGEAEVPAPASLPTPQIDPWKQAALKVEESRGEPEGRQVKPDVPEELKQYRDRRRFLSIQVAEWREQQIETPHDFAALVELIKRGELIEVPALGDDYILYGVGLAASDEPLTHYDKATGKSITLYASDDEFAQDEAQLKESLAQRNDETAALAKELAALPKKERDRRKSLTEEMAEKRRDAETIKSRLDLLDSYYQDADRRKLLASEYEELSNFAHGDAHLGGKSYDLQDPAARREFKSRLLSFARPPALAMIKEIGHAYHEQFKRLLPITSLVRTDEYQRQLNSVNPNATLIETAPHTTGLAFDIYYHFMSKAEQEFVMNDIARLEDAGRVEALRELRDHFHVFTFAEGHPPDEKLIEQQIKQGEGRNGGGGDTRAEQVAKKDGQASKASKREVRAAKQRSTAKKESATKKGSAARSKGRRK